MMNSFKLNLPGKHFNCPSILNDSFAGQSKLGWRSLPFMTWNTSFQPLFACKVSFEKSADSLTGTLLQVTIYFSLAAFQILSSLTSGILLMSWSGPLCVHLVWESALPGLLCLFPSPNQGIFIIFSNSQLLALCLLLLAPLLIRIQQGLLSLFFGILFSSCHSDCVCVCK